MMPAVCLGEVVGVRWLEETALLFHFLDSRELCIFNLSVGFYASFGVKPS